MTSPPLDSTLARQRQAWHDITALVLHTRSNNVGCGMQSSPLGSTDSQMAWHGMPTSPLGSTNGRTTSGVACHHRLWAAHMVKRRRAWHDIIAFGLADIVGRRRTWHAIIAFGRQTWSNDVGRGMPSLPLGSTDGRTVSGKHAIIVFGQHTQSNDVGRGMPSSPLGSTHGRTTLGVA